MGQRNERIRGLEADHLSICKLNVQDPNYLIVRARFEALSEGILNRSRLPALPAGIPAADRRLEEDQDAILQERLNALRDC